MNRPEKRGSRCRTHLEGPESAYTLCGRLRRDLPVTADREAFEAMRRVAGGDVCMVCRAVSVRKAKEAAMPPLRRWMTGVEPDDHG